MLASTHGVVMNRTGVVETRLLFLMVFAVTAGCGARTELEDLDLRPVANVDIRSAFIGTWRGHRLLSVVHEAGECGTPIAGPPRREIWSPLFCQFEFEASQTDPSMVSIWGVLELDPPELTVNRDFVPAFDGRVHTPRLAEYAAPSLWRRAPFGRFDARFSGVFRRSGDVLVYRGCLDYRDSSGEGNWGVVECHLRRVTR